MEMAQSFDELITEVCAVIGFKEPQRLIDGEAIFLNDVMFSIIHEQEIDPNRIYIFVTFGQLPQKNRIKVVEELLKENHGFRGKGPGFTISPWIEPSRWQWPTSWAVLPPLPANGARPSF
jgi:hypothetical protein